MRIKALGILATAAVVLLSSCWKDDERFVLPPTGPSVQKQVNMGSDYSKIVYFNVTTQQFLIRNLADWDLSFESGEKGLHIRLNGGKGFKIHKTTLTDFEQGYTLVGGEEWRWDAANGDIDSTALGTWWADNTGKSADSIYILNTDPNKSNKVGSPTTHLKRLQIVKADETGYWVKIGEFASPINPTTYFIPKDNKRNNTYLNMTTGQAITDMEPEKGDWDIVFTHYQHIYYDQGPEPFPYQVSGVLLNSNGVLAYEENNKPFEEIDINYAMAQKFTDAADVIGFDWKSYNQTSGRYTVDASRTYIIKALSGYYYKMRFLDFYDDKGVKGTPTFDLQRL